ncbi:hypothetical protein [Streptomyces sp. WMMC897]|uniref:hypothetical protein n=1 Tax=Streptomyces sp. WMMC897 TaxID=3014782 RepID=UPI0022B62128|nr:hypothetical protein [Streptomyces sp. WMMC897]MCZ7413114.1 hypothetical protein [Streptomyces sp. WMMC897]MCZ7415502.1 hypothetical protein [Streptomyces sp. WMMC897]
MSRPTPEHGTSARYKGSTTRPPCRCRRCKAGWNRDNQQRALRRLAGEQLLAPAAPVTAHIRQLRDSGMHTAQIAAAAGMDTGTIYNHATGRLPRIRADHARRILAVTPTRHVTVGVVPACGTVRRIKALYAQGYGRSLIAAAAPITPTGVAHILTNGESATVTVASRDAILAAYSALAPTPGPSTKARRRAGREGWRDPQWWEDWGGIDDPAVDPATAEPDETPRYVALAEDWFELERQGYDRRTAAERLGVTRDYLQHSIARYQRQYGEAA